MPNHVRNTVHFDCSDERLREILTAIQYDKSEDHAYSGMGTIDFNKIIPMPESLQIESGSNTDRGIELYMTSKNPFAPHFGKDKMSESDFYELSGRLDRSRMFGHYRTNLTADEIADATKYTSADELIKLGETAVNNLIQYHATTWYDWSCGNWNTKWNSYDPGEEGLGEPPADRDISFSTAWSAPHPILEKLSEMFLDVSIAHKWADEDLGNNCGEREYEGGECVGENLPDSGSKEALDLAFEQWNYSPEEVGYVLSADENEYIYAEGEEFDLIEVCCQPALFSNERLTESDIPEGTLCYDLRESDIGDGFATIEPHVRVNHGGSVIVNEPIDFGKDGFIAFTDDTSPNFLGEKLTFRQFLDGDFDQKGDVKLE